MFLFFLLTILIWFGLVLLVYMPVDWCLWFCNTEYEPARKRLSNKSEFETQTAFSSHRQNYTNLLCHHQTEITTTNPASQPAVTDPYEPEPVNVPTQSSAPPPRLDLALGCPEQWLRDKINGGLIETIAAITLEETPSTTPSDTTSRVWPLGKER